MFSQFISQLQSNLYAGLPGVDAQYKMAPLGRMSKEELIEKFGSPIQSAVMILFYPINDKPHFVLTLRPEYNGAHSGQVSFPGGKRDDADESLLVTALRETEEEIGIPQNVIDVIGELTDLYIPASRFLVQPYVGYSNSRPEFVPNEKEVKKIIEVPVEILWDETLVKATTIHIAQRNIDLQAPYFDIFGHVVWGATAMMLSELKEVAKSVWHP